MACFHRCNSQAATWQLLSHHRHHRRSGHRHLNDFSFPPLIGEESRWRGTRKGAGIAARQARAAKPEQSDKICVMSSGARWLFSFPDPVNELAARTVAGVVVILCALAIGLGQPWLLVPIAYGFWARVLTGPKLSPLGQIATRVVAPKLGPSRPVPGPPKRFAQAMGTGFSTLAIVLWFGFSAQTATWVVLGMLGGAAFLESFFGYCLGCRIFSLLMRIGLVPESACASCADLSLSRT
jgi:hypothetical protein